MDAQLFFHQNALVLAPLTVAIVLLLASFFYTSRRNSTVKGNTILLVGPPDAGKTAIFSTLAYRRTLPSNSSLQSNASVYIQASGQTSNIVDVPGHPRIRDQFQEHLPNAKAVVFVVDASTISRNGPAVAEHLHNIFHALTTMPPSQIMPPVLILAHKTDLLKSSGGPSAAASTAASRVRTILERELEKRRTSQSGGVGIEGLGEEGDRTELGGLDTTGAGAFKFDEWEGGDINFAGTFVTVGKTVDAEDEKQGISDGLSPLTLWFEEL